MPAQSETKRLQAFIDAATVKHDGRYDYEQCRPCSSTRIRRSPSAALTTATSTRSPTSTSAGSAAPTAPADATRERVSAVHDFKAQAIAMHGDRYDYSAVTFVDQHTEVTILCRTHGPFPQRPTNHLDVGSPSGCPDCANQARRVALKDAWTRRTRTQRRKASTGEYLAA